MLLNVLFYLQLLLQIKVRLAVYITNSFHSMLKMSQESLREVLHKVKTFLCSLPP